MSGFERGFQDAPAYMRECEQSPRGSSRKSRQKPQSSQEKEGSEASSSELVSESDKPSEDQPSEEITKPATPESESDKDSSNRASSEIRKSTTPEPKSGASRMENSQSPQPKAQPKETREELLQGPRMVAVEIHPPPESNLEEYEFLPGHFDVNYIIDETEELEPEPFYRVKLRSGEVQKVSSSHLKTLNNGQEALRHFQNFGPTHESSSTAPSISTGNSSNEDEAGFNDSNFGFNPRGNTGKRRSGRAKNLRFTDFFAGGSEDEAASSSSDDIISYSKSTSRKRQLRRGRPRGASTTSDMDSDFAPQGTRFSTRHRTTIRSNLRERYEDDISENESAARSQKFYGAKEVFRKVPSSDPFRHRHRDFCDVCKIAGDDSVKGVLVFCQGCTFAYHQLCLGPRATREHLVTKVGDGEFVLQCRRCLGLAHAKDSMAPHQGYCQVCHEKGAMSEPLRERLTPKQEQQLRLENDGKDLITKIDPARINNLECILSRCAVCYRAFHFNHLSVEPDENWQCHDCSSAPGEVAGLVAWRPAAAKYPAGFTADTVNEVDKEYLVRWKEMSYLHTTWMPGSWVWGTISHTMRRAFLRNPKNFTPHMTAEEAIPEDFYRVDIVFDVKYAEDLDDGSLDDPAQEADIARIDKVVKAYVKFKGLTYEESVWEAPPDPSNTERWKDFKTAYEDWVKKDYVHLPDQRSLAKHLAHVRKQNFKSSVVRNSQPEIMTGGKIMDYQQDGMNWLYYMWFKQQNAILADEMGLGKTIQVIGLFASLIQDHKCWPFLVVVPNSTCPNWRKEIKTWVPSIRVVTYYGSAQARKLAQQHELFADGDSGLRCHVVVTSYETMVDDSSRRVLSKVPWAGLVVDEGQRLKNDKSQIYEALSKIKCPFKVLLTGTPLQNNVREIFNLLQFCDPTQHAEALEEEYGTLSKENIPELHNLIRPYFLRRTKAQVLTFLPPIVQIILPVSMTVVQKKLYKSILAKNPQLIKAIFQRNDSAQTLKQAEKHNLNNILMQLRKCLCHPFVYSEAIEERTSNAAASHRQLVDAAGKLQLLELMLPKLQRRGHRVLIFSQFLDNLDIIEDFLDGLGLLHCRLDGRMSSLEKQKQIDNYNAEDSPYFAFLLSTRSGGVGINLASADTVIIMDPDFNPHQDMQALSRAHRIGQKNKVLVFQLMTRNSAEEKIMQIGKKKMVLDHVLIDRMVSEEDDGQDLESILRHGAQALFNDDDSGDVRYDSESVDKLLDRSQAEQAKSLDENPAESHFSFAHVWANDNHNLNDDIADTDDSAPLGATVWEKILQEREQAAADEARKKAETLGRGKRKRTTVDYSAHEELSPVKRPRDREAESDVEFKDAVAESESDSEPGLAPDSDEVVREAKKPKVRAFERINLPTSAVPALDGQLENIPPCLACNQSHPLGHCRLKLAGVEHCGLCGLAHFGHGRTCPHFKSETMVAKMLDTLKHSDEDPELVHLARKYLSGIRGDLAQRKRKLAGRAAVGLTNQSTPGAMAPTPHRVPTGSPFIDMTGSPGIGNTGSSVGSASLSSGQLQQAFGDRLNHNIPNPGHPAPWAP
ncbi:putative chromatin remodeling complex subunit (Chd3) [Aspergillus candidus]|uniref:Chromatin remodeling complex subunit n=1 Tax=Aspergillus candidus TaxID=41067 RepID=A0A2I2FHM6_ASPCN|nr:hypothetical protein BDW47DRAFT_5901 [Aspergillus candidus]PLB40109.1 hypothetical protein BDW47DRAFT_5901 [Aspergillus candidus]